MNGDDEKILIKEGCSKANTAYVAFPGILGKPLACSLCSHFGGRTDVAATTSCQLPRHPVMNGRTGRCKRQDITLPHLVQMAGYGTILSPRLGVKISRASPHSY